MQHKVVLESKRIKLIEPNKKYLKEYKEAYELSIQKIKENIIKKHDLMFGNVDEIDVIQWSKDNKDRTKLLAF